MCLKREIDTAVLPIIAWQGVLKREIDTVVLPVIAWQGMLKREIDTAVLPVIAWQGVLKREIDTAVLPVISWRGVFKRGIVTAVLPVIVCLVYLYNYVEFVLFFIRILLFLATCTQFSMVLVHAVMAIRFDCILPSCTGQASHCRRHDVRVWEACVLQVGDRGKSATRARPPLSFFSMQCIFLRF